MKALKEGRQPVSGPPPEVQTLPVALPADPECHVGIPCQFNADFGADGGFMLPPPPTEAPGAGAPAAMPSLPMPPTTTPAVPYASPTPFQTPAPTPAPYQPPAPAPAPYQPPAPVPAPAAPYHPPAAAPSTRTPGPGAGARHNQFLPAQFKDAIEESKYAIQFSEVRMCCGISPSQVTPSRVLAQKQNAAEAIKCLENAIRYLRK